MAAIGLASGAVSVRDVSSGFPLALCQVSTGVPGDAPVTAVAFAAYGRVIAMQASTESRSAVSLVHFTTRVSTTLALDLVVGEGDRIDVVPTPTLHSTGPQSTQTAGGQAVAGAPNNKAAAMTICGEQTYVASRHRVYVFATRTGAPVCIHTMGEDVVVVDLLAASSGAVAVVAGIYDEVSWHSCDTIVHQCCFLLSLFRSKLH
jgi:hypothetical protein